VYYGDLHNHTAISDGLGTADEAYRYARDTAGLDFFSLSDHDYGLNQSNWGRMHAAADAHNEDGVFTALWGFEWSSDEPNSYGHCTVIATDDYCSARDTAADTFTKLCAWLFTRNGVAFLNHPLPLQFPNLFNHFYDAPSDKIVGLEVWTLGNVATSYQYHYYYNDGFSSNDNHKGFFDEALCRGWKIGAAGGSDNHDATWGTKYDFRLAILASDLTRQDLLAAISARRFFATLDKNVVLSFSIDGCEMGSTVTGCCHDLRIIADDREGEPFSRVMLFNMRHDTVRTWLPDTCPIDIKYHATSAADDYFYVKLTQPDGDEALSSPVWVSCGSLATR
jgi:hypothetical protein